MGADMVQVVVFLMGAAAIVLAAAACIGETMRLRDAHKDMELRVFALENEVLHLRACRRQAKPADSQAPKPHAPHTLDPRLDGGAAVRRGAGGAAGAARACHADSRDGAADNRRVRA